MGEAGNFLTIIEGGGKRKESFEKLGCEAVAYMLAYSSFVQSYERDRPDLKKDREYLDSLARSVKINLFGSKDKEISVRAARCSEEDLDNPDTGTKVNVLLGEVMHKKEMRCLADALDEFLRVRRECNEKIKRISSARNGTKAFNVESY